MRSPVRLRRTFGLILFVALCGLGVVSVFPTHFLAQRSLEFPLAQAIALRGVIAAATGASGLVALIVALVRRLASHKGGVSFALAVVLIGTSVAHVGVMVSRGVSAGGPLPRGGVNVLQYNTLGGKVSVHQLADVIQENSVSIVTLPETQASRGKELQEVLAQRGLRFERFDNGTSPYEAPYKSIVVLVATSLGRYQQVSQAPAALGVDAFAVYLQPEEEGRPEIISVHPQAPVKKNLTRWAHTLRSTYALCESHPDAVVAGDFNSTRDHEDALSLPTKCRDALQEAKIGGIGTWPTHIPAFFGSPIDRILMPEGWHASVGKVIDLGGSDHRGVLVHIQK